MATEVSGYKTLHAHALWMVVLGAVALGILFTLCWITAAYGKFSARIVEWMSSRSELDFTAFTSGLLWSIGIGAAIGAAAVLAYFLIHLATARRNDRSAGA